MKQNASSSFFSKLKNETNVTSQLEMKGQETLFSLSYPCKKYLKFLSGTHLWPFQLSHFSITELTQFDLFATSVKS